MDIRAAAGRKLMALAERQTGGTLSGPMPRRTPYTQPSDISATTLKELLADRGRGSLDERQFDLLRKPGREGGRDDVRVFLAGETKWRKLTYVPPLALFCGMRNRFQARVGSG